ncbi:MAG: MoaD/ThiS family protein [Pseudomonadota bacterium]
MPPRVVLNGWFRVSIPDAAVRIEPVQSKENATVSDLLAALAIDRHPNEILVLADGAIVTPDERAAHVIAANSEISITPWFGHLSLRTPTNEPQN